MRPYQCPLLLFVFVLLSQFYFPTSLFADGEAELELMCGESVDFTAEDSSLIGNDRRRDSLRAIRSEAEVSCLHNLAYKIADRQIDCAGCEGKGCELYADATAIADDPAQKSRIIFSCTEWQAVSQTAGKAAAGGFWSCDCQLAAGKSLDYKVGCTSAR